MGWNRIADSISDELCARNHRWNARVEVAGNDGLQRQHHFSRNDDWVNPHVRSCRMGPLAFDSNNEVIFTGHDPP
ncbi:hypothetical protein D3C80_2060320 [compost metagenome]